MLYRRVFTKVIIVFTANLKQHTMTVCTGGCDSVQELDNPYVILIDGSLFKAQESEGFYAVLVHELGHVSYFKTTSKAIRRHTLNTLTGRRSPGSRTMRSLGNNSQMGYET